MFMGKVEFENTIKLLKVRNKECTGIRYIYSMLAIFFGIELIGLLEKVFTYNDNTQVITFQIYSSVGLFLMVCACAIYTNDYKVYNSRHQVFPQSNFSRFTSYELFCYLSFIKLQLITLGMYFIQYGICLILNLIKKNIAFAYHFDLQFLIAGFIVNLMYGFLCIGLIILIGVLDRKFRWIFRVIAISFVMIEFISLRYGGNILYKFIQIFTQESSILLFLLKAFCLLILIILLYHSINRYTKYYEVKKNYTHAVIWIAVPLLILVSYLLFSINLTAVTHESTTYSQIQLAKNTAAKGIRTVIDVNDLPDDSIIKIKESFTNESLRIPVINTFNQTNSNNIIIDYVPNNSYENWIDLNTFSKPKLDIELKGTTLLLHYTCKNNVKLAALSPYSLMGQFDYFHGKQLFKEHIGSQNGYTAGSITIYLPKDKKLTILK